ncbi:MAG TPA: NAD-dependent epimerase/dehydratase family protein [Kofleriaceae bacterium]|nr:NAD-dependent epimerase/dehydratase family protein [Kofleriaceae bacterium]
MTLAVITGATGLLGGNLAEALRAERVHVRAIRRPSSRIEHLAHLDIEWMYADLDDVGGLTRAFAGADVVFHAAASVEVGSALTPAMRHTNVDGTAAVLAAVRAAGAGRLVHVSSVVAVGLSTDGRPCDERAPWNFDRYGLADGYSISKHEAEELVRAAGRDVDAVIINPTYMFGPLDARPSSGGLILDVVRRRVPGWAPGLNDFVDVRDVARGALQAWRRGARGERYILGGERASYREIFERIAAQAGVAPPRLPVPRLAALALGKAGDLYQRVTGKEPLLNSTAARYAYTDRFQFTHARATRELGYRHGSVDVAIADALAWFRAHGML